MNKGGTMEPGSYVGNDGRTYRVKGIAVETEPHSLTPFMEATGTSELYSGHPDYPAARSALAALIEAEAPTITYEPVTENQQQYIVATVDLYPHGKMRAHAKTKFEAAEALISKLRDLYEVMWKEHVETKLETHSRLRFGDAGGAEEWVEFDGADGRQRLMPSGKPRLEHWTGTAWASWKVQALPFEQAQLAQDAYRKGREVALEQKQAEIDEILRNKARDTSMALRYYTRHLKLMTQVRELVEVVETARVWVQDNTHQTGPLIYPLSADWHRIREAAKAVKL